MKSDRNGSTFDPCALFRFNWLFGARCLFVCLPSAVLSREEARAKLEDLQRRPTRLQVIASSYWPCAHFDQFSANRLVCFYSSTCSLAHRCLTGRCFCNVARSLDPWFLGSLVPWVSILGIQVGSQYSCELSQSLVQIYLATCEHPLQLRGEQRLNICV